MRATDWIRTLTATAALLLPAAAAAQPAGAIEGSVADAGGGALPGVTVTLGGPLAPPGALQVSGADGRFAFAMLPAGDYVVVLVLPGFETREAAVTVAAGETASIAVVMEIERLMESITVVAEEPRIFATNVVAAPMVAQQSAATSVLAVVDNLPGVSIQEGDAFGADDWSTSVSMRGFQVHLDEAQIGTTIDGFPNGTSDYWTGSKANRFIDAANMGDVQVSQGTADLASRSIEALGGTFDFATDDPARERTYTASVSLGENDAQRYYLRLDTGALLDTETYAWVSASRQESRDWVQQSVPFERDHLAAKVVSAVGRTDLSAYFSHDDTGGPSYQRLFTAAEYAADPRWDRLIDTWTDTPWVNQAYRAGWGIPRRNTFGYLKADVAATDAFTVSAGVYFHRQRGRGDWMPPYIVDVTDDGGGPESELRAGATVRGGDPLGQLHFASPDGVRLAPASGCVSSILFPYGGAGPEHDAACHPAHAVPLQSYRHSHYGKDRWGLTLDEEWFQAVGNGGNRLRAGIWYEDSRRLLGRDWHKIIDARVDARFDETPYWQQYDWRFPQNIAKWYVEDTFYAGPFAFSGGVKHYIVNVGRSDLLGDAADLEVDSDSDLLPSGGVTWTAPVEGLELFAGYSQNFKSLSDRLLEVARAQPGQPGARDRRQHRLRHPLHRRARGGDGDVLRHRLPQPDLLPHPGHGRGTRLPDPRRGRLLQRGRHRIERGRAGGDAAGGRGHVRLHRLYLQRLGVHRHRRRAGGRRAGHRAGRRRRGRAGNAVGAVGRPRRRTARGRRLRQVHLVAGDHARQPLAGGCVLARRRLPHLCPGCRQRAARRAGAVAGGEQPAGQGLPGDHRRAGRLHRRAAHDLAEHHDLVLMACAARMCHRYTRRRPAAAGRPCNRRSSR